MSELLKCSGLQRKFGDFLATKGIDLTVQRGEIDGIIGANGAGKTTLLNIVSGFLRPTAGSVVFNGNDVTGLPPRELALRGIARSFQVPQLFTSSTARENIMLALSLLAQPQAALFKRFAARSLEAEAQAILEAYSIEKHADVTVANIPQGVRKLLDIAMATCADPELVLLDEPTSGVSSDEKNELLSKLIDRFRASSTTVIFIEHDMDVVREYATRVVALYEGRVIADGNAAGVFADQDVIRFITGTTKSHAATGQNYASA